MKKFYLFLFVPLIVGLVICHREEFGWIAVNSEPQGAAVYLDDSLTGEVTNCVLEDVPVGEHPLKLSLDGYVDWDTLVEVEAESPTTITATMILESDTTDTTDTIPPGTLLWKSTIESAAYPLLYSNEKIYIVGKGGKTLYVLAKEDGSVLWQYTTAGDKIGFYMIGYGDTAYVVEYTNPTTWVCSFDPYGNKRHVFGKDWTIFTSAAITSETQYWSWMTDTCGLQAYGGAQWNFIFGDCYLQGGCSSIAIGNDGQIYIGAIGDLYSLNEDGTCEWCYEQGGGTPVIGIDGTIYSITGYSKELLAINHTGQLVWQYSIPERMTTQAVVGEDGTIYFGSYSDLYALNSDGSLKWRKNMNTTVRVTPLIGADGTLYCDGYDGLSNGLYAFDANDGTVKWKYETELYCNGELALAEDGTLFVWVAENGSYYLHAIKTGSQGLANSSWPKYQADNRCSGCAR